MFFHYIKKKKKNNKNKKTSIGSDRMWVWYPLVLLRETYVILFVSVQ